MSDLCECHPSLFDLCKRCPFSSDSSIVDRISRAGEKMGGKDQLSIKTNKVAREKEKNSKEKI